MKKWMCICMAAVLAMTAMTGCAGKSTDKAAAETTAEAVTEASGETAADTTAEAGESAEAAGTTAAEEAGDTEEEIVGETGSAEEAGADEAEEEAALAEAAGKHHIEITVRDYGTISVELDGDHAPITVANFLKLAGDGFYDGLTFHRIISGFMIQGGDPLGTGMGGSDKEIKGEFAANGVDNPLSHTRGAISMARSQRMDSASSQFFIVHEDSTFLDGNYACFGYVTEGIEVVDAICEATKVEDNNGTVAKNNQPVIESIKVID